MHVLGCGPIGLLYASAMLDAYDVGRKRNHRHDEMDDDGDECEAAPVTLLLRSHHEFHLVRRSRRRRSGRDIGIDDDDDDCDESPPRRYASVVVRRPPSSSSPPSSPLSSSTTTNDERMRRFDDVVGDVASSRCIPAELTNHERDDAPRRPITRLLLCTKANDAIDAVCGIRNRLSRMGSRRRSFDDDDGDGSASASSSMSSSSYAHDDDDDDASTCAVIVLSNGALAIRDGLYERLDMRSDDDRSWSGGARIVLGTTTHGAYRTRSPVGTMGINDDYPVGHYDITHAGIGTTVCADREFVDLCSSIGWDARHVPSDADMDAILWRKLAANCVINPLTAIYGIRNGVLLDVIAGRSRGEGIDDDVADNIRTIASGILEEVSAVATMEMAHRTTSTANALSVSSLEEYVLGVMSATRDNVSSMLQDVEAGRTTEVRYLNGYVSKLGRERHGIDCSLNSDMCRLVEGMIPPPPSA
jgi:2-dehydropantoate 2-reductase